MTIVVRRALSVVLLAAITGCVQTTVETYIKVPESRVDSAYVSSDADFSRYRKLQPAPLEIYYVEGQGEPDPEDLARLRQIFRDAFLTAIGDDYEIVDEAGPDVLGVRASVVDLEAPSEVYTGASFTVEFTVSYEFTVPTEMSPGIYDVEAETWIVEEYETLVGEGTTTYSFELTAPEEEGTWSLEADVWYSLEDEWTERTIEPGSWEAFEISVVNEGGGGGIPGFPYISIAFGLILVLLLRDRLHI